MQKEVAEFSPKEASHELGLVAGYLLRLHKNPDMDYSRYVVLDSFKLQWKNTLLKLTAQFSVLKNEIIEKIGAINNCFVEGTEEFDEVEFVRGVALGSVRNKDKQ